MSFAIACSGAMYAGVPTVVPVRVAKPLVAAAWLKALAMPKSAILMVPSAVTMRFSGFMSRCTMPRVSAWARPASIPSSTPAIWASVRLRISGRSEPRSTYSIAMYGTPSYSK